MGQCRRQIDPTIMYRPQAPAAAPHISGSLTAAHFTIRSASSSPYCNSAQSQSEAGPFLIAAKAMGMPLTVVPLRIEEARDLYQADLVLIRPDQIVAWRGSSSAEASAVLRQAVGHI